MRDLNREGVTVSTYFAAERLTRRDAGRPLQQLLVGVLFVAVALPIPVVSATGLSLPLPGFVQRMAFDLVPKVGREAAAAAHAPAAQGVQIMATRSSPKRL